MQNRAESDGRAQDLHTTRFVPLPSRPFADGFGWLRWSVSSQGTVKKAIGRDWQRRFARYRIDLPIKVTVLREGGYEEVRGRCGDIGEGGIGAVLSTEVPKGEVVAVEVEGPGGEHLAGRCIIRYRRGLLHGFEFLGLTLEQKSLVGSLCLGRAILP
jgi:PilZ domain